MLRAGSVHRRRRAGVACTVATLPTKCFRAIIRGEISIRPPAQRGENGDLIRRRCPQHRDFVKLYALDSSIVPAITIPLLCGCSRRTSGGAK
jgi:hypothetical protein